MQIYEKFKNYETFQVSFTYNIIKQRRKANRIGKRRLTTSVVVYTNTLACQGEVSITTSNNIPSVTLGAYSSAVFEQ